MISFKTTFFTVAALCLVQVAVSKSISRDDPPPHEDKAKMARYVVHKADWTSIGTISTQSGITGYPFVGLKSVSDGVDGDARGVPYMMMTKMDVSMKDILADNKCTLFFSLAQGDYCKSNNFDAQDPRCARIMLTGSLSEVDDNSEEHAFAKNALETRHPGMANWPANHGFFIARIDIKQIAVLDYFGGIEYVTPEEYFAADINNKFNYYFDNEINVKQIH